MRELHKTVRGLLSMDPFFADAVCDVIGMDDSGRLVDWGGLLPTGRGKQRA